MMPSEGAEPRSEASDVSHPIPQFTNAVLYNLAYPNNICGGYTTKATCEAQATAFSKASACFFDQSTGTCVYLAPHSTFVVQVKDWDVRASLDPCCPHLDISRVIPTLNRSS